MTRFCSLCAVVLALASAAVSQSGSDLRAHWPGASSETFAGAMKEGLGFSFVLDGEKKGPEIPKAMAITTATASGVIRSTFRHAAGLVVIREARPMPEFEAVEYTLRFRNDTLSSLPPLTNVQALDLNFGPTMLRGLSVVSAGGGLTHHYFPPEAFAVRRRHLGPMTEVSGWVDLTTEGGNSSNRDLPFFFVESEEAKGGIFVAFGWSGPWSARVYFRGGLVRVTGGIPDLHIRLRPGEELSGPRILVGSYRGPVAAGSNRLRRLIREYYTPRLGDKKPLPAVTYDHWWGISLDFDEALLRQLADSAAALGQEYFLVDAGWYAGTDQPDGFSAGVGNWEEVDRKKFPHGLRPFSDYVRSKGLQFGLWFDLERVARGTLLARQHPDWIIWLPGNNYGLLDYGRRETREYVSALLDRCIREFGIRYIRYDVNIDPLAYWQAKDQMDRRGITQIHHIEGFYQILDRVRQRHPETVLEGCAGGGRRIDLETVRRFHTFWISDHTLDPHIVRSHLDGLHYFLPGNYAYVCAVFAKNREFGPFAFQSFLAGAFGTGGRIDQWSARARKEAQRHIELYKKIRRFLVEDYFPLTPQPRDLDAWDGWQFHDPQSGEGFVQVFRLHSPMAVFQAMLKGLDPARKYRFSDAYSGASWEIEGASALTGGIPFDLPQLSSQVLLYAPAGPKARD